ncbi:MAG TPA: 2Fe-2S iron-sulfur cluster-binding protein [Steroidobacteraceae bacterium]
MHPDADDAVAIALDVPKELQSEYVGLAGQHVVLRTELDGAEARRTYSLTNAPGEWPLRIVARVHVHGQMSRHLADELRVGDQIDVLPPNGSLTPRSVAPASMYVGFASGCGITPVLSIVKATLQANPTNRFILFYGNTNTDRVMCLEELLGLKDRFIDRLALHFVMSREPQEVELYNGRIDAARVRELARTLFKAEQVAEFFVCGPGDMIDQVSGVLRDLNVPADRIHSEHFRDESTAHAATDNAVAGDTALAHAHGTHAGHAHGGLAVDGTDPAAKLDAVAGAEPMASGTARAPAADPDLAQVTVLMDGRHRTFTMKINDDTVLDAASRAGLELPFSCRAGVCSTCRTKVVSGAVEMDQNYALEDWELEQGYVLACQSRCKTPTLELDYDEK